MNACLRAVAFVSLTVALPSLAASEKDAVVKPLKVVIQSIRYGKDLGALKQFGGEAQGRFLLGDDWEKGTAAQRKEFVDRFHTLFAKIAFPKVRENFKHLESVTYEPPQVKGDEAQVQSTLLILHPMKKQELKLKYSLAKTRGAWKVVDVTVLGDSMLQGIRDDQIRPILKEGGWEYLLKLMREKDQELGKVTLK